MTVPADGPGGRPVNDPATVQDVGPQETPQQIMRTRTVTAEAVLANRVDLRGYPYRLLSVAVNRGVGADQVTQALAAAEALEATGWQLVTITEIGSNRTVHAILRRR